MSSSLSVIAASAPSCAHDPSTLCARVYDLFGVDWLAANAEAFIATPARILLVVVMAALARVGVNRAIGRLTQRTASGAVPTVMRRRRVRAVAQGAVGEQGLARRTQRAEAIGSVLRSSASIVILGIAV